MPLDSTLLDRVTLNDASLTEICLCQQNLSGEEIQPLCEALSNNVVVKILDISNNNLGSRGAYYLAKLLINNSAIVNCNIANNYIGLTGAKALAKMLKINNTLQALNIQGNEIGAAGIKELMYSLIENISLQKINVGFNKVIPARDNFLVDSIGQVLFNHKALTHLGLSGIYFNPQEFNLLTWPIRALQSNLLELDLSGAKLGDAIISVLAEIINSQSNLISIKLCDNDLTLKGMEKITASLSNNGKIVSLDLSHNILSSIGTKLLANALIENKKLQTLNIEYNSIGADGIWALADMLKINKSLTALSIGDYKGYGTIDTLSMQILAIGLQQNTSLKLLKIINSHISDKGSQTLADILTINHTLLALDLKINHLSVTNIQVLAKALKQNNTLQKLGLSSNSLRKDGFRELADMLMINSSLTHLDLSDNYFAKDEEYQDIIRALTHNSTLKILDISSTYVANESAQELVDILEKNNSLTHISITKTQISSELVQMIEKALRRNRKDLMSIDITDKILWQRRLASFSQYIDPNENDYKLTYHRIQTYKKATENAARESLLIKAHTKLHEAKCILQTPTLYQHLESEDLCGLAKTNIQLAKLILDSPKLVDKIFEEDIFSLAISDIQLASLVIYNEEIISKIQSDKLKDLAITNSEVAILIISREKLTQNLTNQQLTEIAILHLDVAKFLIANKGLSQRFTENDLVVIAKPHLEIAWYMIKDENLNKRIKNYGYVDIAKAHPEIKEFILTTPSWQVKISSNQIVKLIENVDLDFIKNTPSISCKFVDLDAPELEEIFNVHPKLIEWLLITPEYESNFSSSLLAKFAKKSLDFAKFILTSPTLKKKICKYDLKALGNKEKEIAKIILQDPELVESFGDRTLGKLSIKVIIDDYLEVGKTFPLVGRRILTSYVYMSNIGDNEYKALFSFINSVPQEESLLKNALYWAVSYEREEIIDFLLQNGADINTKRGHEHRPALHHAITFSKSDRIVQFLLAKGADPEIKHEGSTALHLAVEAKRASVVNFLIQNMVDVNSKNNAGKTPYQMAIENNLKEIIEIFKQMKARDNFIRCLITLVRARNQKDNLWQKLPEEIILYIISFIHFNEMDKTLEQGIACAEFIIKNINEIKQLLEEKKFLGIKEQNTSEQNPKIIFKFFKAIKIINEDTRKYIQPEENMKSTYLI